MSADYQPNRWRCLEVGCNPVLDAAGANKHTADTGHRTAKWPVRSKAGKAKARARNKSGYYDKYNVGDKSAEARGIVGPSRVEGRGVVLTGSDFAWPHGEE